MGLLGDVKYGTAGGCEVSADICDELRMYVATSLRLKHMNDES